MMPQPMESPAEDPVERDSFTTPTLAADSEAPPLFPPAPREIPSRVAEAVAAIITSGDPRRASLPLAPPCIAGYELLEPLGSGGMGVVYKARQVKADRVVALKMIRGGWHAEPQLRSRFQTEIAAVASLAHPNIVQVYEVGEQDGYDYFSMEFMPGGRLDHMLAGVPQAGRDAAQLVARLTDAMHFAHERRVIHRDLKPANILLADDGTPKIADFGLAKRLEGETGCVTAGDAIGTPCYMAPEQAVGQVSPASDIYSLGAILYELLTGRPPHHGVTTMDTLQQVMTLEPVPPSRLRPDVPRDLETICLKCLQKQSHQRYANARGLADDLRRFLVGEPIAARPIRAWERGLKWARRRPAWAALIVVSTLATLAFAVAGWWSSATLRALSRDLQAAVGRANLQARAAEEARQESKRREQQAIQSRLEADEQRRQADRQRQIADANFRQAGEVLDKFIDLSQDPRLRSAELQELRSQVQQTALAFYEGLVQQRSDDPEARAEQGRTLRRIARITDATGNKSEAIKQCVRAIAVFEELVRTHPNEPAYSRELALSHYEHAAELVDVDRPRAVEPFRRAMSIQEQLRRAYPQDPAYRRELAVTCLSFAGVLTDRFLFDEAQPLIERSLAAWQELADENPEDVTRRRAVASAQMVMGRFHRFQEEPAQLDQAEVWYSQALATRVTIYQSHPADLGVQYEVADSHLWLGGLYDLKNDRDRAEEHFRAALTIQQSLYAAHPQYTIYGVNLGRTQTHLANLARDRGQLEQSLAGYTQAIDLLQSAREKGHNRAVAFLAWAKLEYSESLARLGRLDESRAEWRQAFDFSPITCWRNQLARAEKLARRGNYVLAAEKAAAMAKERSINSGFCFDLAAIYALAADAVQRDAVLDPVDREKLAADYVDRGLALLAKAHTKGYFRKAVNLERLKTDKRLDRLRASEDFQKLLAAIPGGGRDSADLISTSLVP